MYNRRVFRGFIWGLFALAGLTLLVMLLWNWLLPGLFGLAAINYWQALGILVLSKILFGRFGFSGHGWHGHGSFKQMGQKWHDMSPAERRDMVAQMRAKHSGHFHRHMQGSCCAEAEQQEEAQKSAKEPE